MFEKCSIRITLTVVGLNRSAAVWQACDAQRWIWQNFQLRAKREKRDLLVKQDGRLRAKGEKQGFARKTRRVVTGKR